MSIPNRTVSITGVFAEDASTTIPSAPVSGVAYRNTAMTGTVIREGWAYKTIVDSANFNQALYEYSSVTAQIEKYGFLPWSNLTDYVQGSLCLGSDGVIYQAKQATGPSTTALDPTTDSGNTYWEDFVGNTYVTKATTQTISGNKTFTGANTFSGNDLFTGANTFSGSNTFTGATYLPHGVKLSKQDSNLEGGQIDFLPGNNEPNANQTISIDRYNGQLRFFGATSSGSAVSFNIDMQNEAVYATQGITSSIVTWGMPNYQAIAAVGNVTDRTAPANVLVQCSLTGRAIGHLSVGGQTFYINHQDGYGTTNYVYRDFFIPKGWRYSTSGLSEVYEIPLVGG